MHLSFNLTNNTGVFHGHWPLFKSVIFPDTVVDFGPIGAAGVLVAALCIDGPGGGIVLVGVNFYSRVKTTAAFEQMLAAAEARGIPAYWNGTLPGTPNGTLNMVNHTLCTYPPVPPS